jgi:Tfp pilus assembly protein PilP
MKQKRQIGILFILVVVAAIVWLWNFRGKRVVTADASQNLKEEPILQIENPHIRLEEIDRTRKAEYRGSGRNPFTPVAAPAVRTQQAAEKKIENYGPQQKPPDPPLPPLTLPPNVKFYGYITAASRRALIHDGDEVYIVGEGDILLKRFRIVRIGNDHLEFEEISTGRVGTAPLPEEQPAGSQQ